MVSLYAASKMYIVVFCIQGKTCIYEFLQIWNNLKRNYNINIYFFLIKIISTAVYCRFRVSADLQTSGDPWPRQHQSHPQQIYSALSIFIQSEASTGVPQPMRSCIPGRVRTIYTNWQIFIRRFELRVFLISLTFAVVKSSKVLITVIHSDFLHIHL